MRYVPSLPRALVEEATRHHHATWGTGRTQEEHTAHNFEQLERAGPELLRYVGLVEEGSLVASCKRYSLLLRHATRGVIRALGIGAVFTPPPGRGRGAASALLKAVMGEAADLGYEAALLYSDIDPAFYARLGFVALPAFQHLARLTDLPEEGALEGRPAAPADLDRVLALHEEGWDADGALLLRPARSRAIWRYFRWRNRISGEWMLTDRGRDVGYLIAALDEPLRDMPDPREPGLFWVDEWAAPGIPADRVWATVRALASSAGARVIGAWLPPHQESERFRVSPRPSGFSMIAPLAPSLAVVPSRAFLSSFEHF